MNEDKPNYYAIIPALVRYDPELKPNEKLLYGEITSLTNKTGECYATNKYFANLYEVELETISRWIKHLKDFGYIDTEIVYKNGTKEIEKRVIRINGCQINKRISTYIPNNQEGYCSKSQEGIDEKVKENNTSINNIYNNNNNKEKNLFELIEENFGRTLSPIEYEELNTWNDTELTRYAIKQAVLNGVYNLKYISKILYEYERNCIKTVQQAQQREKQHNKQKESSSIRQNVTYKTSRDRLRELEEQARIEDERERKCKN